MDSMYILFTGTVGGSTIFQISIHHNADPDSAIFRKAAPELAFLLLFSHFNLLKNTCLLIFSYFIASVFESLRFQCGSGSRRGKLLQINADLRNPRTLVLGGGAGAHC
jgi:hypothetical protein